MTDVLPEAIAALAKVKLGSAAGVERHLLALGEKLARNEKPLNLAKGRYRNSSGLLAVTDRRLLFVADDRPHEFPLEGITWIPHKPAWQARIEFRLRGELVAITNVEPADRKKEVFNYLRDQTERQSPLLENVIKRSEGQGHVRLVFTDIESYSQRKGKRQNSLIRSFTQVASESVRSLAEKHKTWAEENSFSFSRDIVRIPTGDGLAVVFYQTPARVHLDFAEELLALTQEHNERNGCAVFSERGWCNCHDSYRLRIALGQGVCIIYRDINGNYNVAGRPVNLAARLMGEIGGMQIGATHDGYTDLIEMTEINPEDFLDVGTVPVKGGVLLQVYLYAPTEKPFVNSEVPSKLRRE